MGRLAVLVLVLVAAHVQVSNCSNHQCYVCAGDPSGSLASQQPILKCEDFKKEDTRFVKNCPPNYEGCLTIVSGHHMTRTCADIKIDDCQMANGVRYCYCTTPLCNDKSDDPPPDDEPEEDSVEGSATGEDKLTTAASPTRLETTSSEPHVRSAAPTTRPLLPCLLLAGLLRRLP